MAALPGGTVTFLVADLEHLANTDNPHPEAQRATVERLNSLLDACARDHQGVAAVGGGGLCYALFPLATAAVAAALALERGLQASPAAGVPSVRARLALHTGTAAQDESGYGGGALSRCASLAATGHGGQVLLSLVAAELVWDSLPLGASLLALGPHRLRDLGRPEPVYQLVHPDLPGPFPPLRSLDHLPHNLPGQLTSFIGRERELAAVRRLLGSGRMVTLTGPGGCGKTRLALHTAAAMLPAFPDGAWLVDLAPLRDPALLPQQVATALGLREVPGRPLLEPVLEYCRRRQLLLVLDNCEHLVAACAELATVLLQSCPGLRILATSREALAVAGETVRRVTSLALPDPQRLPPGSGLTQFAAVRLFIERAQAVQDDFAVTNANAQAVAEICHRLDGIPLAIELAAAWTKLLAVEQIAERLGDRFRLLAGGSRAAVSRHQTLRAAVDWSFEFLSRAEQSLFARLAIFAGGFTLAAAEAVCSGADLAEPEVLALLAQLVDKSLVLADQQAGQARYRMLETIRQYAEEKLRDLGEEAAIGRRHRNWHLSLAEQAEPETRVSRMLGRPGEEAWLQRLGQEHDNLRAALRWCLNNGEADAGLRLAGVVAPFWHGRGYYSEGRRWLEACLERVPAPSGVRAAAVADVAELRRLEGDYPGAAILLQESLSMYREAADPRREVEILDRLGNLARVQQEWERATDWYKQALAGAQALDDAPVTCRALVALGSVAQLQGNSSQARSWFDQALTLARVNGDKRLQVETRLEIVQWLRATGEYGAVEGLAADSLALAREVGDSRAIAWCLFHLHFSAFHCGDMERARKLLRESLALRRAMGLTVYIADCLWALSRIDRETLDLGAAAAHLRENLLLVWETGDRWWVAKALDSMAWLAATQGQSERAARLFGAGAAVWEALNWPLNVEPHRSEREQYLAATRAALSEAKFETAWTVGQALSPAQAVEYALAGEAEAQFGAAATTADISNSTAPTPAAPAPAAPTPPGAPAAALTMPPPASAVQTADAPTGAAPTQAAAGAAAPNVPATAPATSTAASPAGPLPVPAPAGAARPAGLTAREAEIVRLVAQGLTDREVATRLFISPRTVDTHLRNIFGKVGVSNRAGLASWATRAGLNDPP